MRVVGDDVVEFFLIFLYFPGFNFDIGGLSLHSSEGLVNHHTTVWQCLTFPLLTAYQQYSSHRGGHTCTDGSHVGCDELHGVIDT